MNVHMLKQVGGIGALLLTALSWSSPSLAREGISPITAKEREQVTWGMSTDQVEQLLGKPLYVKHYSRIPDTSWVYLTRETASNSKLEVDFGTDGKVKGVGLVYQNGKGGTPNHF